MLSPDRVHVDAQGVLGGSVQRTGRTCCSAPGARSSGDLQLAVPRADLPQLQTAALPEVMAFFGGLVH